MLQDPEDMTVAELEAEQLLLTGRVRGKLAVHADVIRLIQVNNFLAIAVRAAAGYTQKHIIDQFQAP